MASYGPRLYWDTVNLLILSEEEYVDAVLAGRGHEISVGSYTSGPLYSYAPMPSPKPASLRMQEGMVGGVSKKGTVG